MEPSSSASSRPAGGAEALRVALIAIRSELAACAIRIDEALGRKTWWNPSAEPLPAISWDRYFADLADPALHPQTHAQIESAYQRCDALNRQIARYLDEYKRSQFLALPSPSLYKFRPGDEELLRDVRRVIGQTNTAVTAYVER